MQTHLIGTDPRMSAEQRTKALSWLEKSHRDFYASIDGVSDEQWNWKPAPERWSVGETAQHIVLAVSAPPNPAWEEQTKGKTELIESLILDRTGKAKAPEPVVPRQALTCNQVKERFEKQRAAIVKFAAETQLALKEQTAVRPFPVFGPLNAYHWLINVPLHTVRHHKQIAEVKGMPGYP